MGSESGLGAATASGSDAGGSAAFPSSGPQSNGLIASILGSSGLSLGSGGGIGDFLGGGAEASSPAPPAGEEGVSIAETTQKLKDVLSDVGGGSQEDPGEIDFLLPEEAVYAAVDAAAEPAADGLTAAEPVAAAETPIDGPAEPTAATEPVPPAEGGLSLGGLVVAGPFAEAGPPEDQEMQDAVGAGAEPAESPKGVPEPAEAGVAIEAVPAQEQGLSAGNSDAHEGVEAAAELGSGLPEEIPEETPEAPEEVGVVAEAAPESEEGPQTEKAPSEQPGEAGPEPEASSGELESGPAAEATDAAPVGGGLSLKEEPEALSEGALGVPEADAVRGATPPENDGDGGGPVKEEANGSPTGSPTGAPDANEAAEPGSVAVGPGPVAASASPRHRSPDGSLDPEAASTPSVPPSARGVSSEQEQDTTPGAEATPEVKSEAGAMVEGSTGKGPGRFPKSGLKKSRLGPGASSDAKRSVGRPPRVVLGPDGTPIPKVSHRKKELPPGSEGRTPKVKPPPPPPRQLTRLRPPSGEAAKGGTPDSAPGKGGPAALVLSTVGTPGTVTPAPLARVVETPRPPMDPKLALMERLGGVLAAPGKFWVHESKLPLWLVKAFEEKTRQMAAIEAARVAREAYRISQGMWFSFPVAAGHGLGEMSACRSRTWCLPIWKVCFCVQGINMVNVSMLFKLCCNRCESSALLL